MLDKAAAEEVVRQRTAPAIAEVSAEGTMSTSARGRKAAQNRESGLPARELSFLLVTESDFRLFGVCKNERKMGG